jgi:signal transduction histidine kinase
VSAGELVGGPQASSEGGWHAGFGMLGPLTAPRSMTHNFPRRSSKGADVETVQESLDRLSSEVAEVRAARKRLALATDEDRRRIERQLHDGPQQHLVALAANVQLARNLVDGDPDAARRVLDELQRDVQMAIEETASLAQRIYPPLLEAGGLGAALRAAAVETGVQAQISVRETADYPPAIAGAVYFCCLGVMEAVGDGARITIEVHRAGGELVFSIDGGPSVPLGNACDRIEALGGRLTVGATPGRCFRLSGSVPL